MNAKKIDELCEFVSGLWTGKKPPFINVAVLRNTNFQKNGELDFTDIAQLDVEERQFKTRQLRYGDIVLEKSGGGPKQPVGRVCVFEKNEGLYSLSNFTSAIRVKNKKELDYKYLHYYLRHLYISGQTEKIQTNSTGIRNLQLSLYKEFLVPLPSLATQQKIVAKLDAIFAEIDKAVFATEANVKNAEALYLSYLNEIFEHHNDDWIERNLKDITLKIGSGATPKGGNESYKESGISLIRSMNVYDEGFHFPKLAFIDDAQANELSNVKIEENDVLLNITGASVARCCVVPKEILPARVNQHVSILRANTNVINPLFLQLMLISPLHKRKLLGVGEGGGTTRQAITKAQLQEYKIRFPNSLNTQLELVEKALKIKNETKKIVDSYKSKSLSFLSMKNSILKQAFNGELIKD